MIPKEIDNTSKAKSKFFCNKMFHNIFWASCMASGGLVIANIIDAVAVGSKMGEQGLAAICIVSPIYILYNVLGYGFSVGGSVIFTRLMGKGHFDQANKHLNAVVLVSVLFSAIIGILANIFLDPFLALLGGDAAANPEVYKLSRDYASILLTTFPIFMLNFLFYEFSRCDDDEKTATCAYLVGCLSDVTFNCLLVIVLDLGVKGAAFSTVIGQIISTAIAFTHFLRRKNLFVKKYFSFDIKAAFSSLHLGFSTSSRHLLRCVFLIITNNILMRFASNGNLYVAVFDVVTNVSYITCFVYTAAVEAVTPLASTFYAESNRTNLLSLLKKSYKYACIGSLFVGLAVFALAGPVAGLFGLHGVDVAVYAIRVFCLGVCFTAFSEVSGAFFQAISKNKTASLITVIQNFVFVIPLTIVVGILHTELFWFVLPASEALSAIVILIVVLKKLPREDKKSYTYIIENNNRDISNMLSGISSFLDDNDAGIKQSYVVTLAAEEMCSAIIKNAFTGKEREYQNCKVK